MSARSRVTALTLVLITCLCATPGAARAQTGGQPPDLSGYWMIPFGPVPPRRPATDFEAELIDRLRPGTVILPDSGLAELAPGDYGGLHITATALRQAQAYDPDTQRSVATTCHPPSVIHAMQGPFPIEIVQGSELLVIRMEYFDLVRVVFLDRDEHPENWPLSPVGHSIGHWEHDTLVVETRHLRPATIFNNGLEHSDRVQLTEWFRLSEDGSVLLVIQQFEDPPVFDGRAARVLPLERGEGHVYPYDCDPTYGVAIGARERD